MLGYPIHLQAASMSALPEVCAYSMFADRIDFEIGPHHNCKYCEESIGYDKMEVALFQKLTVSRIVTFRCCRHTFLFCNGSTDSHG
jgi:glutaredoxin